MNVTGPTSDSHHFQIRFRSSFLPGRTVAFPCDDHGNVDMDRLSEAGRCDYLFARIMTRIERGEMALQVERYSADRQKMVNR